MVAVEHVLDLEITVNFDRHTSVLAPYCNCWEAPSAKSDPGSSQAAELSSGLLDPNGGHDLGSVVTGPSDPREIAAYEAGRGGVLFLVL